MRLRLLRRILLLMAAMLVRCAGALADSAADLLAKGDLALSQNKVANSIEYYSEGIRALPQRWSGEGFDENGDDENSDTQSPTYSEMEVILSLHTNHGTALSYMNGSSEAVLSAYKSACLCYRQWQKQREVTSSTDTSDSAELKGIMAVATSAFFFLGMTHQDLATTVIDKAGQQQHLENSARSYAAATKIDPRHWSSFANMGVVLADVGIDHNSGAKALSLELYEEGIMAYQRAINILTGVDGKETGDGQGPTDPPENVREVASELHYRIGLCLVPLLFTGEDDYSEKQCTLHLGPDSIPTNRGCIELAAFEFQTALQFHPHHDGASNALTIATADATFGMSTDVLKVKSLFDDYAPTFEHSLVQDLGYNGFHRMRSGFDRAMASEGLSDKKFPLVVDAGCGTGLAGEVFQNISQTTIGVDLSQTIIDLAKQSRPNLYSELKTGDVKEILHQYAQREEFVSLLVAGDTFIYFNDLNDLFEAIRVSLEDGGYAVFSLENVSIENEKRLLQLKRNWRWQLTPSGRVAHRKEYVEETAKAHSLDTILYEKLDDFRAESGQGVRGHLFVLKKHLQGNDEF
ncbi:hypothetical protein ACHAWF_013135 [Thalassiosira exigua]